VESGARVAGIPQGAPELADGGLIMSATTERTPYTGEWLQNVLATCHKQPLEVKQERVMSFSFSAKGKTHDELAQDVLAKMGKVVEQQPDHAIDSPLVHETVLKYSKTLHPNDDEQITAQVYGSVATLDGRVRSANVGVTVTITGINVF
jgi:hypothetical protein